MEHRAQNTARSSIGEIDIRSELRATVEDLLRQQWGCQNLTFSEHSVERTGNLGILSSLAAAHGAARIGLWRHQLRFQRTTMAHEESVEILVKRKASDALLEEIAAHTGERVHPFLRGCGRTLLQALDLVGASERELALYSFNDIRLTRHRPATYATAQDAACAEGIIAMEYLSDCEQLCEAPFAAAWNERHICAAIEGIAEVHAIGYAEPQRYVSGCMLRPQPTIAELVQLIGVWQMLAECARPILSHFWSEDSGPLQASLLHSFSNWWSVRAALPQTMIHNDFSPRNIAFRQDTATSTALRVCAYDWELTALGLPEHDIAELLCFTLPEDATHSDAMNYRQLHRTLLEQHSSRPISSHDSDVAFQVSLKYLLVNRITMYALYSQLAPDKQAAERALFQVLGTWRRLYNWFCER